MEATNMIWGVIVGYIVFACAISMITTFWIRYHLKQAIMYPQCLLSDKPIIYPHCLLKDRPNKKF